MDNGTRVHESGKRGINMSVNGYANEKGEIEIIISSWDKSKILKTCVVQCEPGEVIEIETNLLETKRKVSNP